MEPVVRPVISLITSLTTQLNSKFAEKGHICQTISSIFLKENNSSNKTFPYGYNPRCAPSQTQQSAVVFQPPDSEAFIRVREQPLDRQRHAFQKIKKNPQLKLGKNTAPVEARAIFII